MKRKKLLVLLPIMIVAFIVVGSVAISGPTYTWEKTFEETKPEIECEIEISDYRVVGCPVKILVRLRLEDSCELCLHECKEEWNAKCDDGWEDRCDYCEHAGSEDKCCYHISGTYSVVLYWWNETEEDWHHLMYLQEEINVTLIGWKHIEPAWRVFTFTPKMEGEYKVVVTFATETETHSFTSED